MALTGRVLSPSILRCYFGFIGASAPKMELLAHRKISPMIGKYAGCGNLHCAAVDLAKKDVKVKTLKRPVDDVYLEDLYDPLVYDLDKALSTLKRYMELDLEDKDSPVHLKLDLHLAPKGKGKLQTFWQISEPVHKFNYMNKVCVFTDNASSIKQCLEYGAFYAGGQDIIQRVLYGKEQCDAYVTTFDFSKANLQGNAELVRTIGKLMPTKKRGINEDLVAELIQMRDGMLVNNQRRDIWKCNVVVGLIEQTADEIKENILLAMELVRKEQNPKHPPIIKAAAVSCCDESLTFELKPDDEDD